MKSIQYTIKEVYYCDCPYCCTTLDDEMTVEADFFNQEIATCPYCGKKFRIKGGN